MYYSDSQAYTTCLGRNIKALGSCCIDDTIIVGSLHGTSLLKYPLVAIKVTQSSHIVCFKLGRNFG